MFVQSGVPQQQEHAVDSGLFILAFAALTVFQRDVADISHDQVQAFRYATLFEAQQEIRLNHLVLEGNLYTSALSETGFSQAHH